MDRTAKQVAANYLAYNCCVYVQLVDTVNMGLEPARVVYVPNV